jgi:hypothetical protein
MYINEFITTYRAISAFRRLVLQVFGISYSFLYKGYIYINIYVLCVLVLSEECVCVCVCVCVYVYSVKIELCR